jgi:hypothetical protein
MLGSSNVLCTAIISKSIDSYSHTGKGPLTAGLSAFYLPFDSGKPVNRANFRDSGHFHTMGIFGESIVLRGKLVREGKGVEYTY